MLRTVIVLVVGAAIGSLAGTRQPHMIAALDALKTARAELEMAEHNKGGHRAKALEHVNRAIEQARKGVEAGEMAK